MVAETNVATCSYTFQNDGELSADSRNISVVSV